MNPLYAFGIAHGALAMFVLWGLAWSIERTYPALRGYEGWRLLWGDLSRATTTFRSQETSVKWGVILLLGYILALMELAIVLSV